MTKILTFIIDWFLLPGNLSSTAHLIDEPISFTEKLQNLVLLRIIIDLLFKDYGCFAKILKNIGAAFQ